MNPKRLVLATAGVICLVLALALFSRVVTVDKTTAVKKSDGKTCPDCGMVLPYNAGGECPFCKLRRGPEDPKKAQPKVVPWTTTDYLVIGCVVFLTGGGGFLISRALKGKVHLRKPRPNLLIRCGRCRRGVRYFDHQAGKRVLCPGCMWTIDLPALPKKIPSRAR
jgi:hypothetical protein